MQMYTEQTDISFIAYAIRYICTLISIAKKYVTDDECQTSSVMFFSAIKI